MPIDPIVQVVLEKMRQMGVPPLHISGPVEFIPVRIYTPQSEVPLPLKTARAPVEAKRYAGMVHGFILQTGAYDQGRKTEEHAISALRKVLHD